MKALKPILFLCVALCLTTSCKKEVDMTLKQKTVLENADIRGTLVKELKNTPNYKALMNRGANFRYVYRSAKNPEKTYLDVTITKNNY